MQARIYKPAKSAMQSGKAKSAHWVLEFETDRKARNPDPLMGWTSSSDTRSQVKLKFDTREEAIAYAKRENLVFSVEESRPAKRLIKSYGANFSADRKQPWTH